MALERKLTLADGSSITDPKELKLVWDSLVTPNADLSFALKGRAIPVVELVEITIPAAILERRDSDSGPNSPWIFEGHIHYPTDLVIPDPSGKEYKDSVVFRFQSERGSVFFRIGVSDRLKTVEEQIAMIASPWERSLLQVERKEIIESLKKRIIHYCNHHYRT